MYFNPTQSCEIPCLFQKLISQISQSNEQYSIYKLYYHGGGARRGSLIHPWGEDFVKPNGSLMIRRIGWIEQRCTIGPKDVAH